MCGGSLKALSPSLMTLHQRYGAQLRPNPMPVRANTWPLVFCTQKGGNPGPGLKCWNADFTSMLAIQHPLYKYWATCAGWTSLNFGGVGATLFTGVKSVTSRNFCGLVCGLGTGKECRIIALDGISCRNLSSPLWWYSWINASLMLLSLGFPM